MQKQEIITLTQKLRTQYNLTSASFDIVTLAREMGFTVCNAIMTDNSDGFIIVSSKPITICGIQSDKFIGVNTTRDIKEKRWIIAYELGCYITQKDLQKSYAHIKYRT